MQKIKELAKKVIVKTVDDMLDTDFFGWPPPCVGIYYQPAKPEAISKITKNEETEI